MDSLFFGGLDVLQGIIQEYALFRLQSITFQKQLIDLRFRLDQMLLIGRIPPSISGRKFNASAHSTSALREKLDK